MSALTQHPWPAPTEIYASTNKFMRFAIAINESGFLPHLESYTGLTQWLNNLPAKDWDELEFLPARRAMSGWATLLFTERTRFGLLPSGVNWAPRKLWDGAAWVTGYAPNDGDARRLGVVATEDCSALVTVGRMATLLSWFPMDLTLRQNCSAWATAISQFNLGTNQYGHRAGWATWTFFNYVHAGPKDGLLPDAADPFETQLAWSLEGLPDACYVNTADYGGVVESFVLLSHLTGDPTHAGVAQEIVQGIWRTRFNHASYLVPDIFTPVGPVPGDQDAATFQYMYDTDGLYWANALYRVCHVVGPSGAGFIPSPDPSHWSDRLTARRALITAALSDPNTTFPLTYLVHALAITLDWIRGSWSANFGHFLRKVHHDGSPVTSSAALYGDGKYNTLRMLVGAYWFTGDDFYLDLFTEAWDSLLAIVATGTPTPPTFVHDLMPTTVGAGALASPPRTDTAQEIFLSLIVEAYRASVKLDAPRPGLLARAETFGHKVLDLHNSNSGFDLLTPHHGIVGSAYLQLARASGTLRRIGINLSTAGQTLTFTGASIDPLVLAVDQARAVVYMDDGDYQIASNKPGTSPITLIVAADDDISVF